ncbi:response regulator [Geitlerinema sp. PCC 9228]|uniref:response regulator n=1 Tax=Geitlerinema sp. PCC 9228 TaxID=111611 RepID=UPI0008F9B6C0|nr:response regulator [Geitlerinema sp. PCC 9228]
MQGNLNEIDIRSILQLIELGQRTGELLVEAHSLRIQPTTRLDSKFQGQSWFVFFLNGQIVYATDSNSNLSRLRDYLRRYRADRALERLAAPALGSTNALEYGYLWVLLENKIITPEQGRSILKNMIHETIFDLLSLHQGSFIFEMGSALAPQLTTLEVGPLVTKIMKQVQEWKKFHPYITSPNQCPTIADPEKLRSSLPASTYNALSRWANGKTSIRQIARYLSRDILVVAKAIHQYVQNGSVQLSPPSSELQLPSSRKLTPSNTASHPPHVACIDDEMTVGKSVEMMLHKYGYQVSSIYHPLEDFPRLFRLNPDLVLCDIAMPELDGYELCAMMRQTHVFRHTPIVMLTGKDGFIDRLKARMVGSDDFLSKPFGENELLMLVEQYIGPGDRNRQEPEPSTQDNQPQR